MPTLAACTFGIATVLTTACLSAGVTSEPLPVHPRIAAQDRVLSVQARLQVPSEAPLTGERFPVRGRLRTAPGRPVQLQVQRTSRWRTVKVSTVRRGGGFRFDNVALARTSALRVRAPRWRAPSAGRVGTRKPALISVPISVEVMSGQSSTLTVLPGIAQHGYRPASPVDETQLVAQFVPVREGRTVVLQRHSSKGWVSVEEARQDEAGSVDFTVAGTGQVFRAVARPVSGTTWRTPREVTDPVTARPFDVVFEDTFSGEVLDPNKWVDQLKDTVEGVAASNRQCSRISPSTRRVTDGVLRMGIAADPTKAGQTCTWIDGEGATGPHPYMWNTQIMTRGKFQFRYGYAAARMKVQQAKGMHSAFWLQPHDIPHGPPALGTEIDVMEFFGDTGRSRTGLGAFVHWYENGGHQVRGDIFPEASDLKPSDEGWWDAFHVFSVEWTPTAYIFRVDGREFHRETVAISQAPEYLLLSLLTGDYEYKNLTSDEWAQTAQVDWVRVWAP
jgi:beta-glucanase (GH16 family)